MGLDSLSYSYCRTTSIGFLCFLLLTLSLFAQQSKLLAPHDPIAPRVSKPSPLVPAVVASMVGGPWMVDANFKSTIYLKNVVETFPMTVIPVLHLSNAVKYALPAVTLQRGGTDIVDINAALENLGIASYATLSGYVELQYKWPWVPLCAFIRDVDVTHSLIFTFGIQASGSLSATQQSASQLTEGLWWKQEANVTGFLTLTNISPQPITAVVRVSDNHAAALGTQTITVSPQGMKTLNLQELQSARSNEGGIRISYVGQQGTLLINGGLEDPTVGYSANLYFSSGPITLPPQTRLAAQNGVAELGLMVGAADPMMRFPAGTTFTPYSVLRNISTNPMSVTPTLWWMQAGVAAFAPLPQITLPPFETRSLDMPVLLAMAGLKNYNGSVNLVFDYKGRSGLLFAAGSVDQTNTYVFEVSPRGIVNSAGRSISYWSTANGDDTMITVWNPADEAQDFSFRLDFSGGHYWLPIHLQPRATQTFNISEIIQNQVPDAKGNIIPPNAQNGSAKLLGTLAENQHILAVVDGGIYNVQKATCGGYCMSCDGSVSYEVLASPFAVAINGQKQESFSATWNTGAQYDLTSQSNWSSSNTSIATVQSGLTHGVGAGTMILSAFLSTEPDYTPYQCFGAPLQCPVGSGGGGSSNGTVAPQISISPQLWYFNGNPAPSGFTLGSTTATLTASGGGAGTYGWSITSGSSIAALQGTTSGTNVTSVQIASTSNSTTENDVTVQLQFEPSNGTESVQTSYSLSVDSPYKMVSLGSTTNAGVAGPCNAVPVPKGTAGFESLVPYTIVSFLGTQISKIQMAETLNNQQISYSGENWPFKANTFVTPDGTFDDEICQVTSSTIAPKPLVPQSPLTNIVIDQFSQTWTSGGGSVAPGLIVQTDTLRRYIDHGLHTGVTSPTR